MEVVFSFSLFCKSLFETDDSAPFLTYENGIYDVCLAIQDVVNNSPWKAKVALYTDSSIPQKRKEFLLKKLRKIWMNGKDCLEIDDHSFKGVWPGTSGTLARFQAFKDYSQSDAVIVLDADLHQDTLWRRAFRDFLSSQQQVLRAVLLDYHKNPSEKNYSMCACFTGFKEDSLKTLGNILGEAASEELENDKKGDYGTDQVFLGLRVWPLVKHLPMLSVQMVKWHKAEEFPEDWKGSNETIWENSQFCTQSMM
jgi:hypothetical protein